MSQRRVRINEVSVPQFEQYLIKQSWHQADQLGDVAAVWRNTASDDAEVVLPARQSLKDFSRRMWDALEAVADFERRDPADVALSIINLSSSLITVRVVGADTEAGTIPMQDGVLLFSKARELLASAVLSMYSKRKVHIGKPSKDAASYMDSFLFGQTEFGSYVINVIAPKQEVRDPSKKAEPVVDVALSLASGLDALSSAAAAYEKSKDPQVFDKAVMKGASANMCDALLGFSGVHQRRNFEVHIAGATGPMFSGETKVFSFDADDVPALKMASDYFKEDYVLPQRVLMGSVKKVIRDPLSDVGKVVIQAAVDGAERSVEIELNAKDFHEATTAIDTKQIVECIGDVRIKGRKATLLNHRGFQLFRPGDLFD